MDLHHSMGELDTDDDPYERIEARLRAAFGGVPLLVQYGAYELDANADPVDNLDAVAIEGQCRLVQEAGGDTHIAAESAVLDSPNWLDVTRFANVALLAADTGDIHHRFLEGVEAAGAGNDGVARYRLIYGS